MGRVLKYLFILVAVGLVFLAGYALFSDLPAPQTNVVEQVDTNISL